jgi:hypothetical protein
MGSGERPGTGAGRRLRDGRGNVGGKRAAPLSFGSFSLFFSSLRFVESL